MPIPSGSKLGAYEIVSPLGAGGMGEVYLARDPRLGREVAIKVLAAGRLADETHRQRFVQEARAASALSHPNIVTVHEIETADGNDFIVMEYVPGQPLDAVIPRHGMRLGDALGIAIPIADALARAHAAGIVHRDLKPANVMVGPGGMVKVLDFGLAKLVAPDETIDAQETMTRGADAGKPLSGAGAIAGTPGYMSPEQATGGKVDTRSDVFSFGALLYELVTGRRAFAGGSTSATLAAIVREQPKAPSDVVTGVPKELDRLILRCLRKDPDRRFQHMLDVKVELLEVKEESDSGAYAPVARAASNRRLRLAVAVGGLLLLGATAWLLLGRRGSGLPPPRVLVLTTTPGSESSPTFSPDGSQVAFAWDGEKDGNLDIWLKMIGGSESRQLTSDPAPDQDPSWSPDGRQIAFVRSASGSAAGTIHLVTPLGGPDRKLSDFPTAVSQLSWSADGRWLAAARARLADEIPPGARGIHAIPAEGGASRVLTSPTPGGFDNTPAFSPDGRRLAYAACQGRSCDVQVVELGRDLTPSGPPRRLTRQGLPVDGIAWTRDGKAVVYGARLPTIGHLWRVAIAGDAPPERIELAGRASAPATAASLDRLVFSRPSSDVDVYRFQAGRPAEAVLASSFFDYGPDLSPDGTRIAFSSGRSGESQEIWLAGADGSNPLQLTHGPGQHQGLPRWSPDGRRLAFNCQGEDGHWDIWVIDADGGSPRRLTRDPGDEQMPSWSHDGQWVYFNANSGRAEGGDVWRVPSNGGPAERVTHGGGDFAHEGADGRTLFFKRDALDSPLLSMALAGGVDRRLADCVQHWGFDVGPEGVYYVGCASGRGEAPLHVVEPATGRDRILGRLETGRGAFLGMTVSSDGRTILFAKWVSEGADLMMIENFR